MNTSFTFQFHTLEKSVGTTRTIRSIYRTQIVRTCITVTCVWCGPGKLEPLLPTKQTMLKGAGAPARGTITTCPSVRTGPTQPRVARGEQTIFQVECNVAVIAAAGLAKVAKLLQTHSAQDANTIPDSKAAIVSKGVC